MVVDLLILHIWLRTKGFTTYDYILLQRENLNAKTKAIKGELSRDDIKHKSKIIVEEEEGEEAGVSEIN
jgi:hypothetical protein